MSPLKRRKFNYKKALMAASAAMALGAPGASIGGTIDHPLAKIYKAGDIGPIWEAYDPKELFGGTEAEYAAAIADVSLYTAKLGPLVMLFQDHNGTIPCVKAEDPIGLCLDFRYRGQRGENIAVDTVTQQSGTVTDNGNGTYTAGDAGATSLARVKFPLASLGNGGKWFEIFFEVTAISGGSITVDWCDVTPAATFSAAGVKRFCQTKAVYDATNRFLDISVPTGGSCTFRIISCREVFGIPWTQSSSPSRYLLSALYNKLTKTRELSNVIWVKGVDATVADNVASPDGQLKGSRITFANDVATAEVKYDVTSGVASGQPWAASVYLWKEAGQADTVSLQLINVADGSALGTVAVTLSTTPVLVPIFGTTINTSIRLRFRCGALQGGKSVCIANPEMMPLDDYIKDIPHGQYVDTSTNYETKGFPYYWKADGVDDFGVTPTVTLTRPEISVFAGVQKSSDGTLAILESSTSSATIDYTFFLFHNSDVTWTFRTRGTAAGSAARSADAAPLSVVLIGNGHVNEDRAHLDVSKSLRAVATTDQGTEGNLTSVAWYHGRRAGTSIPLNGRIYVLGAVDRSLSPSEYQLVQQYIRKKMRLSF